MSDVVPQFKFALREDLDGDKTFLPRRAEPFATGWDVRACPKNKKDIILRPGSYAKIPLGVRAFPEEGWWFQLHPRSSSFTKKSLHTLVGVIDNHYPMELIAACQYIPDIQSLGKELIIKYGEAIGQIVPVKRVEMDIIEISNKEFDDLCANRKSHRTGGFGSSGDFNFIKFGESEINK